MQASYILNVRVHSYDNPTNRCPFCYFDDQVTGCCDDFDQTRVCIGEDRCDNTFFYCLRDYSTVVTTESDTPPRCGEANDRLGKLSEINIDGAEIDFTGSNPLGLSNPIPLRSHEATTWNVRDIIMYNG